MKTLLLGIILCSYTTLAQNLAQTNEPNIGETQQMYLCDSFANTYNAIIGNGATWNYSTLESYPNETRTISIEDATTTANAASFPTSIKTFKIENFLTTYYNSTATERTSQGFVFNEPSFGVLVAIFDTDEEKIVDYPFANGNSLIDASDGTLYFTFNGIPQSPAATGSCYAWIDGQGTLLMPDGSTITDVIRYKMIDTIVTNIILFGDLEIIRTQYEYYDITNSNLPVLMLSRLLIQQPGGGLPLVDNSIVLSSVASTSTTGLYTNGLISFETYPNPTNGNVTLKGEFDSNAIAAVYDQSGRLLITQKAINNSSIDLSNLSTGMYLLKVSSNGATETKTIVKQ